MSKHGDFESAQLAQLAQQSAQQQQQQIDTSFTSSIGSQEDISVSCELLCDNLSALEPFLEIERSSPSLTDEEDEEEEEIVSLERRMNYVPEGSGDARLRRTPGANAMHQSAMEGGGGGLRRTPGANPERKTDSAGNPSFLGFGLMLSTPVGTDRDGNLERDDQQGVIRSPGGRPPLVTNGNGREEYMYTPSSMTLTRNPHLQMNARDAFSPNTILLTESLDNLLHDEDEVKVDDHAPHTQKKPVPHRTPKPQKKKASQTKQTSNSSSVSIEPNYSNQQNSQNDLQAKKLPRVSAPSKKIKHQKITKNAVSFHQSLDEPKPQEEQTTSQPAAAEPIQPHPHHLNVAENGHRILPLRQLHPTGGNNDIGNNGCFHRFEVKSGSSRQEPHPLDQSEPPRPLNFDSTPPKVGRKQGGAFAPPKTRKISSPLRHNYVQGVPHSLQRKNSDPEMDNPEILKVEAGNSFQRNVSITSSPNSNRAGPMTNSTSAFPNTVTTPERIYSTLQHQPPSPNIKINSSNKNDYSTPNNRPIIIHHHYPPLPHNHPIPPTVLPHNQQQPYFYQQLYHDTNPSALRPQLPVIHPSAQAGPSWSNQLPIAPNDSIPREDGWNNNPNMHWQHYPHPPPLPHENNTIPWEYDNSYRMQDDQFYPPQRNMDPSNHWEFRNPPPPPPAPPMHHPHPSKPLDSHKQHQHQHQQQHQQQLSHPPSKKEKPNKLRKNKSRIPSKSPNRKATTTAPSKPRSSSPKKDISSPRKKRHPPKTNPATPEQQQQPKAEFSESPPTRLAFKEFYRKFRIKERTSFALAEEYAMQCLNTSSLSKIHWRIHLEIADLFKRSNKFDEARKLYKKVCQLQPYASQGWLEYSKLEEECGDLQKCSAILRRGLAFCEYSESLLIRAIKHEERVGALDKARELLARLKHVGIEKVWRTVLEGALLEARAGNVIVARRVLKYLMKHVPWYGPLYLEAYRLERDAGRPLEAIVIVERGLKEIPRYGPLWFGAFRLCEGLDLYEKKYDLPRTMGMIKRATENISRELLWKVHLEAAQVQERAALQAFTQDPKIDLNKKLMKSRRSFATTVLACPPNLCWKVWLAGGRMELSSGRTKQARKLFVRAHDVVPEKGRPAVLLECARLEEFAGDLDLARAILCKARSETGTEWKVWLESVALEARSGRRKRAIDLAQRALEVHSGTGRLWAALVQLRHSDGEKEQSAALRKALRSVPKSGEVWCEGARLHLNPFVPTFDLQVGEQHLRFATQFTPQYGDSFLESLRLEVLLRVIVPFAEPYLKELERKIHDDDAWSGLEEDEMDQWIVDFSCEVAISVWKKEREFESSNQDTSVTADSSNHETNGNVRKISITSFFHPDNLEAIDTSGLELRCANADPNYGLLWFHCRRRPTDIARMILSRAKSYITANLAKYSFLYIAAIIRRAGIAMALRKKTAQSETRNPATQLSEEESSPRRILSEFSVDEDSKEWEAFLESRLRTAPSIGDVLKDKLNTYSDNEMSKNMKELSGSDFVTGLTELNRHRPLENMSLLERRKFLFGSDSLLS